MKEKETGYYDAVEKEILILVDSIFDIIKRTNIETVNKLMADSIISQISADRETVRKHAAKRNKDKYLPLPESITADASMIAEVNDGDIDEMYNRVEGVYLSMVKFEQSL